MQDKIRYISVPLGRMEDKSRKPRRRILCALSVMLYACHSLYGHFRPKEKA